MSEQQAEYIDTATKNVTERKLAVLRERGYRQVVVVMTGLRDCAPSSPNSVASHGVATHSSKR